MVGVVHLPHGESFSVDLKDKMKQKSLSEHSLKAGRQGLQEANLFTAFARGELQPVSDLVSSAPVHNIFQLGKQML